MRMPSRWFQLSNYLTAIAQNILSENYLAEETEAQQGEEAMVMWPVSGRAGIRTQDP